MAEKKTGAKKTSRRTSSVKKAVSKNNRELELDSKTKNAVKAKTKSEPKEKVEKAIRREKRDLRVFWTALVTFFVTTLLFGMAFLVFIDLEVINNDGSFRIDHGRIYVDRRKQCESDSDNEGIEGRISGKSEAEDTSMIDGDLIVNPNKRMEVKNAQLIEIGDLEFYLPIKFKAAKSNGNGKYAFNLTDDDGWADVKVYVEKNVGDILTYISKKDSSLELLDSTYYMNGTSWVEMKSGASIAYGTRLRDTVYVVVFNVKLESDVTGEAEQMISKTIRLKRIYK